MRAVTLSIGPVFVALLLPVATRAVSVCRNVSCEPHAPLDYGDCSGPQTASETLEALLGHGSGYRWIDRPQVALAAEELHRAGAAMYSQPPAPEVITVQLQLFSVTDVDTCVEMRRVAQTCDQGAVAAVVRRGGVDL